MCSIASFFLYFPFLVCSHDYCMSGCSKIGSEAKQQYVSGGPVVSASEDIFFSFSFFCHYLAKLPSHTVVFLSIGSPFKVGFNYGGRVAGFAGCSRTA